MNLVYPFCLVNKPKKKKLINQLKVKTPNIANTAENQ